MSFTRETGDSPFDFKIPTDTAATSIVFGANKSKTKIMLVAPTTGGGGIELGDFSIQTGKRHELAMTFRSAGVSPGLTVSIDGDDVATWKGNYRTDLQVIPQWLSKRIGLWIYGNRSNPNQFRFHKILFRPL